jgi:hypothetical protein
VTWESWSSASHCGYWGLNERGQHECIVDKLLLRWVLSELFSFSLPDIIPSIPDRVEFICITYILLWAKSEDVECVKSHIIATRCGTIDPFEAAVARDSVKLTPAARKKNNS